MKLSDLSTVSDNLTDELLTQATSVSYANQAISVINSTVGLKLPFIENANSDYTALDDSWFQQLMVWFLSYGIKMNDGSMREAQEYKSWFDVSLGQFMEVAIGPEEDGSGGVVDPEFIDQTALANKFAIMDGRGNIDTGWFNL